MAHADIVNLWFREHLAGGALGQATEAYNQVHGALPALIAALDNIPAPAESGAALVETADGSAAPPRQRK